MMSESKNEKENMEKDEPMVDNAGLNMRGHILIRDKDSGEEIVNKRNAIHYGNMARIVALALNNGASTDASRENAYINYIARIAEHMYGNYRFCSIGCLTFYFIECYIPVIINIA